MNIAVIGLSLALYYRETMPNGKIMVKAFPELEFGGDGWWAVMPLNVLTSCLYGVTLFSYVCWIVWTAPRRSMTVPGFGARYRFCFGSVRPDRFWWIIVQLTYGTVINLAQIIFPAKNVHSQVYFLLLTLILLSILQFRTWPFKFNDNNWVDLTFKLSLVVLLIMITAWIDTSALDEDDINHEDAVYAVIIICGFIWALSFAAYHFSCWLVTFCYPTGLTKNRLTQTVWNLRDVTGAMLMLKDKDLVNKLSLISEHDLDGLRQATTTMIHVLFGQQESLHERRHQRLIMGGGFRAWDHNATVLRLLKDTESNVLETRVLQSCRFRLSLLKLARAALAPSDLNSYHDHSEFYPGVHKNLVLNRRQEVPAELRQPSKRLPPTADGAKPSLSRSLSLFTNGSSSRGLGTSGSMSLGLGRSVSSPSGLGANGGTSSRIVSFVPSQALSKGMRSHLAAKKVATAIQLNKGELTREAFLRMVGEKFAWLHLPIEHVNEMFNCMDVDNSGTVSVTEFTGYMMANTPHDLVHHFSKEMAEAWDAAAIGAVEEDMHPHDFVAMVHRNEVDRWRDSSHMLGDDELDTLPLGELIRAIGPERLDIYDEELYRRSAGEHTEDPEQPAGVASAFSPRAAGQPTGSQHMDDVVFDLDRAPVAQTCWIDADQSALGRGFAID
jgi:Ca2+-binding EF-hand superfamily protein